MKKVTSFFSPFLAILWISLFPFEVFSQNGSWKRVEEGLSWVGFDSTNKVLGIDSKISVVKIDPRFYSFKLLCASEHGKTSLTVKDWCKTQGLMSGINAGMYQEDGLRNVGYMKNFEHINNPRLNNTYKAVLAFNRSDPGVPEIQIIDLKCQEFDKLKSKYQTFAQNIRMISCRQENVWAKQEKMWSMAVFGMDKSGNALFIFSEAPYSGYDFVNLLLSLPLSIYNAMYLEGGTEASLYFSGKGIELERVGVFATSLKENSARVAARPIPNAIGITKKPR